jgi:transcriptional regulator with XRE-family HTH domain
MKSKSVISLPLPVQRELKKLAENVSNARRRRRISTAMMAERAMISRPTLMRLERGDPTVSMGILATVLFVLGMDARLAELADPAHDRVGLELEDEALPKRIRGPRRRVEEKQ